MSAVRADDPMPESLSLYLREAGSIPLLTVAEERDLAQRITAGDRSARERFITANLRLVVAVARSMSGLTLEERVAEGNIGLLRAVEKFDWRRGNKFSTYATWWIRQAIDRATKEHDRVIEIPVHVAEHARKLRRMETHLWNELSREPTLDELADALGWEEENIMALRAIPDDPISLDMPVDEDQEHTLGEILLDDRTPTVESEAAEAERRDHLRLLLAHLEPRSRAVLEARFGLDGKGDKTLEEIGLQFGVTRERIRQIELKAIARLRGLPEAETWFAEYARATLQVRPYHKQQTAKPARISVKSPSRLPSKHAHAGTVHLPHQRPLISKAAGEYETIPGPPATITTFPTAEPDLQIVVKSTEEEQRCKRCGETKALTEFYKTSAFKSGRDSTCKACRKARSAEHEHESDTEASVPSPAEETTASIAVGITPPPLVDVATTPPTLTGFARPQLREKFWQQVNTLNAADLSAYAITWHEMEVMV